MNKYEYNFDINKQHINEIKEIKAKEQSQVENVVENQSLTEILNKMIMYIYHAYTDYADIEGDRSAFHIGNSREEIELIVYPEGSYIEIYFNHTGGKFDFLDVGLGWVIPEIEESEENKGKVKAMIENWDELKSEMQYKINFAYARKKEELKKQPATVPKEVFVQELGKLLSHARVGAEKCTLDKTGNYVIITYDNGYERKVNVECDSRLAIITDVCRYV